jgi:hypothetical protein
MTDQRQPSKPLEVVGWLSTSGYRAVIHEPTRRAMTNKWQPSEAALDAAIERVAQPQHIAISAATDKLRHILADMHDSAEDGTCLFDAGDGSCLGCKAFEALAELMAVIDRPREVTEKTARPEIICLCGSSRFIDLIAVLAWEFEKQGKIVLSLHLLPQWYTEQADHQAEHEGLASQMDALHLKKIELADTVFVVNKDGYIGESTAREIEYTQTLGKKLAYLEKRAALGESAE